jgi:hypothetical protein
MRGPYKVVIKKSSVEKSSFESVVEKWVEFWRWQSKAIEKKRQARN